MVVAYSYTGEENTIIPVVNVSGNHYTGTVLVSAPPATILVDLLSGDSYTVDESGMVTISIDDAELIVLHYKKG